MKNLIRLSVFASLLLVFGCNAQDQKTSSKEKAQKSSELLPQPGDISLTEMSALMEKKDIVLLDVRTPDEYAEGAIPNAKLINVNSADFKQKVDELGRDKAVIVYCRSGARSSRAMGLMNDMGFNEVYNLEGGYLNYSANTK